MSQITELRERLEKKGWSTDEIERAVRIIDDAENKKKYVVFKESANRILYWMALLVLTVLNFIISILLALFLVAMKGFGLYVIVAALGLVFGLMFNLLLLDLEHLEKKHHMFATIFIPLVSIATLFIAVNISNSVSETIGAGIHHYPITVSSVYVLFFILPYLFSGIKQFK